MKNIKFAFPKGSLQEATKNKLAVAGWKVCIKERNYSPAVNDVALECALLRPQKFPGYVDAGLFDLAITGSDCVENYLASQGKKLEDTRIVVISELVFSKKTSQKSKWKIIVRHDSPIWSLADCQGKKFSCEMVDLARKFFRKNQIQAEVEFSWGATESEVLHGLVDGAIDLCETSSTIIANPELRVLDETVLETATLLIANEDSLKNNECRVKAKQLAIMLNAVLIAERKVWIEMNAPKNKVGKIKKILPSMRMPDEIPLNSGWVKLRSLVDRGGLKEMIPRFLEIGADNIVVDKAPDMVFSQIDLKKIHLF